MQAPRDARIADFDEIRSVSMAGMTSIAPGAHVRDRDGVIGVVERVDETADGGANVLVVRQEESGKRYAFPVHLVSSIRETEGRQSIQLDVARSALDRYASATDQDVGTSSREMVRTVAAPEAQAVRVPLAGEELVTEIRAS